MQTPIPTHAVKAVIRNANDQVLFLKRHAPTNAVALWDLPGGLVEDGENDIDALAREIEEELSVAATIGNKVGEWSFFRPLDGETVQVTNYEATLANAAIRLSHEHVDSLYLSHKYVGKIAVKDPSIWQALGAE